MKEAALPYLCNHHMTIKRASPTSLLRPLDMFSQFPDDWRAKGHVRDEMTVHHVEVKPVTAPFHTIATCFS